MTEEQINIAIDKGGFVGRIYRKEKMSPKNIDHALKVGRCIFDLLRHQKLTNEQITQLIGNKQYRKELLKFQDMEGWREWVKTETEKPDSELRMSKKILLGIFEQ
jgi:hypothetical protein